MTRPLPLPSAFDFTRLDQIAGFEHRVLMLDYDGTLAPFRPQRMEAVPYPGVDDALRDLAAAQHTRIVIVSGRTLAELRILLGAQLKVELWGTHGWERQMPDGRLERWQPSAPVAAALESAAETVRAHMPPEIVELKPASVAVHTRALTAAERSDIARLVETYWVPLAAADAIDLRAFDGGYELRAAGRTKGSVVESLRREVIPSGRGNALFAYLGDDDTDEDAFAALTANDWPILVRAAPRPSRARFYLTPPDDLLRFIQTWTLTAR